MGKQSLRQSGALPILVLIAAAAAAVVGSISLAVFKVSHTGNSRIRQQLMQLASKNISFLDENKFNGAKSTYGVYMTAKTKEGNYIFLKLVRGELKEDKFQGSTLVTLPNGELMIIQDSNYLPLVVLKDGTKTQAQILTKMITFFRLSDGSLISVDLSNAYVNEGSLDGLFSGNMLEGGYQVAGKVANSNVENSYVAISPSYISPATKTLSEVLRTDILQKLSQAKVLALEDPPSLDSLYNIDGKFITKNYGTGTYQISGVEEPSVDLDTIKQIVQNTVTTTIVNTITEGGVNQVVVKGEGLGGPTTVTSEMIKDLTIQGIDIATGTITADKIASGVIPSSTTISDGSVSTSKLADGAVTSAKISDGTITTSDLSSTLSFPSGALIDLSAVIHSSTSKQGLILPNVSSSSPSIPTSGQGYLAYDTADKQVLFYNGSAWGTVGSGTITSVNAGNGLSGGGSSGAVTLSVNSTDISTCTSSSTQKIIWDSTNNRFTCGTDQTTGGSASSLSSITNALTTNTLSNGDLAQVWNWSLTTANKTAFSFGESSASIATGNPYILGISTLASSTANPLLVTAKGTSNGIKVDTSGLLSAVGAGGIQATTLNGATFAAPGAIGGGTPGSGAFTTLSASSTLSANGGLTIAANQGLTFTSGTGTLTQNYSNTTGTQATFNHTNSASTGTNTSTALSIAITGTANTLGSNTITGLNFPNVVAATNNTYNGITFGTGFNNYLTSGTVNLTAAGALSGITTINASGQITSTVTTGTAPFVVASTTNVANLNASSLSGATFASPGSIGSGTPGSGAFTTLTGNTSITDVGLSTAGVVTNTSGGLLGTLAGTTTTVLHGNAAGAPTFASITGSDLASNITISTTGNISTTSTGTITSAGAITGPTATNTINGLIINSGALSGISTISTSSTINGATISGGTISGGTLSGTALTGTGAFTINTTGNTNGVTINTATGASGNSGAITIQSGGTSVSGTSGNVTIDVGAGVTSNGTIGIGTANSGTITIGRSTQGITLPGFTGNNAVLYGTTSTGVLAAATTSTSGLCLLSGAATGYVPAWTTCPGGGGSWSQLTAPSVDLSLAMAANHTTFTWGGNTGTTDMFKLTDNATNTGTGYILDVAQVAGSSAKPLKITQGANTLVDTTSGGVLTLTSAGAATWGTTTGNLTFQVAGTGTTGNVQIGAGGGGSATPDFLVVDQATGALPAGTNGAIALDSTGKFNIYEGAWKVLCNKTDLGCGTGSGAALSAITAATAGNTINNGDNAQVWNWQLTTASKTAFTIGENVASNATGTPYILGISTLNTSTANPLLITAQGTANGVKVDTAGLLQVIGTGGIKATDLAAGTYANALTLSSATNSITVGTLTATGGTINGVNIGATTPGTGKFTTLTSTGATDLANAGASNVTIATTGTGTVAIGNATGTFALTSSGGLNVSTTGALTGVSTLATSGLISANGGLTLAANQNLTFTSGTGTFTQNYSNTTGTEATFNHTNSASTGTNTSTVLSLAITGTANAAGSNTITGLNFPNVTAATNNTYNGITFGTGFNNYLTSGTVNLTAAGALSGITTLGLSGAITGATATNTINGIIINSGAVSNVSTLGLSGAITGATATNTINGLIISSGALSGISTISTSGQITSTLATGTAPFVVASTTNVANLNASSLSGATFASPGSIGNTSAGSGAFTTLSASSGLSANGGETIAANQSLTFTSGTGTITQNYSNTTGTQATFNHTNSASSGTNTSTVLGLAITGTANAAGSNTITGLNFPNVVAATNNTYNGITFGTGFNNYLTSGTINLTAAGAASGLTTLGLSGAITGATATNTINGIIINSGAVSGVSTLGLSGAITGATATNTINGIVINSGAVSSVTTLGASGTVTIGSGGNTYTFNPAAAPALAGTARPDRRMTLTPEFAGAVLTGTGTGTMTSDFCAASAGVGGLPATNTTVCNTSGDTHNYYNWTTTQGTAQTYSIYIKWRVPDNFSAWDTTNSVQAYAKRSDATNGHVNIKVFDTANALNNAGGTEVAGAANTWVQNGINISGGTWTAGSYVTLEIDMTAAATSGIANVGEINLNYFTSN